MCENSILVKLSHLVEESNRLIVKISEDDLVLGNSVLIFGTNAIELIRKIISCISNRGDETDIYILLSNDIYYRLKEEVNDKVKFIVHEGKYDLSVVDKLHKSLYGKKIDSFFFYTQQENDLGNLNILQIILQLNSSKSHSYGIDKENNIFCINQLNKYCGILIEYININEALEE